LLIRFRGHVMIRALFRTSFPAMNGIVVLITTPSKDEAERIARHLIENRLAACVNIVPSVRSLYRWEGNICDETESLLIVKTQADRFDQLSREVKAHHRYTVPEIIALPIVQGSPDYLNWIQESTVAVH